MWGIVAMETSVPLMTGVHLPLRTCLYCAVCKCYYALRRPDLAEVLARRALGKVSELIQLQSVSSTPQSKETEHAYKEAAIKVREVGGKEWIGMLTCEESCKMGLLLLAVLGLFSLG